MKKYILAIDQGTTSSRVNLFNLNFKIIDAVQKEFNQFFPKNGWVEHDAIEILKYVKLLINKILKKNKLKSTDILSIGITNQRETTVLWIKKNGKPIYPGSYSIPKNKMDEFYKLYHEKVFVNGEKEYLTERQNQSGGPVLIDLDFRYGTHIEERQHDENHITDLIDLKIFVLLI